MWRQFVRDYFTFTRLERAGIQTMIGLTIVLSLLPYFFSYLIPEDKPDDMEFKKEIARLEVVQPEFFERRNKFSVQTKLKSGDNYELFYFDPNITSEREWEKLGVRKGTIKIIQNYLNKGGHFSKPEDLRKIFGLPEKVADRLIPYIKLKEAESEEYFYEKKEENKNAFIPNVYKRKEPASVNINSNDTSSFLSLPGIGPGYTARILNWRTKLGGFHSVAQVSEMYGMPDSLFQQISKYLFVENPTLKKININDATSTELSIHPYISYSLANAIVAYRKQHGKFQGLNDLKQIMIITEDIFMKISPYLSVD